MFERNVFKDGQNHRERITTHLFILTGGNMNTQTINYIDNYAIITDRKLKSARNIASFDFVTTNMRMVYQVLSNYSGFKSLEDAYEFALKKRWRKGVNIIAICEDDFEDNGFVVAKISSKGDLDTMDDGLIKLSRGRK